MSESHRKVPLLAQLIGQTQRQERAAPVTNNIFALKDVSNAYVVNTSDGHVMINAGFIPTAKRNKVMASSVATGPLQAIFLTQAHPDHYGGVPAFSSGNVPIIAQQDFDATRDYFKMLDQYLRRRSGVIWAGTIADRDELVIPNISPTVTFRDAAEFTFGSTQFHAISTPGGEALDASIVWLPETGVVFTGNLFGPLLNSVPNLCTTRGDKPRSAARYLTAIQRVIDLHPKLLISGHSNPVHGEEAATAVLTHMRDAVQHIHDETVKGMNAGKTVHELMRTISIPETLPIGELHGKVSWAVRTIWEEYSGWFHMDSTASLYGTPATSINADMVELAGADNLAKRAMQKALHKEPLEAIHLSDIVLSIQPRHQTALRARITALEILLDRADGENMSEVMWLNAQLGAATTAIEQSTETSNP